MWQKFNRMQTYVLKWYRPWSVPSCASGSSVSVNDSKTSFSLHLSAVFIPWRIVCGEKERRKNFNFAEEIIKIHCTNRHTALCICATQQHSAKWRFFKVVCFIRIPYSMNFAPNCLIALQQSHFSIEICRLHGKKNRLKMKE